MATKHYRITYVTRTDDSWPDSEPQTIVVSAASGYDPTQRGGADSAIRYFAGIFRRTFGNTLRFKIQSCVRTHSNKSKTIRAASSCPKPQPTCNPTDNLWFQDRRVTQ